MKLVVLQCGGMADEAIPDLGGRTPLEQARTPALDLIASRGILGLARTIPRGLAAGTDVGTLSVLGYDPTRYPCGPGTFEAASVGVELGPADVAYRVNLVSLEAPEGGVEVMRDAAAGHPMPAEAAELVADLGRALGGGGVELHPGSGYRHLLVWRNGSADVRTVPPHELTDRPVQDALPQGPGADLLRDLVTRSRAVLAEHPLCAARRARAERTPTAIWPWGPGRRLTLPPFRQRAGCDGAVVAGLGVVRGVGRLAGLAPLAVPGATGSIDTDYRAKAEQALRALAERDFVLVHVAAADESAHRGDAQKKVEALERFDADVVAPVLDGLRQSGEDWRLLVVSDHATPCTQKRHTADPVPFAVYLPADDRKTAGAARAFHERDAREQGIFIPEGHALMERFLRRRTEA
jgi:2,3-bisphosphoglycerate-independent phosphoglycerate mutase